jgi:hypothetical protein
VAPFIEDNKEACSVYLEDEGKFWMQVFDPTHAYHQLPMLVCDGAHRREVCVLKAIQQMRVNFLRPTISLAEMVQINMYANVVHRVTVPSTSPTPPSANTA